MTNEPVWERLDGKPLRPGDRVRDWELLTGTVVSVSSAPGLADLVTVQLDLGGEPHVYVADKLIWREQ